MGGGDLNLKKSWHPSTLKNQEKVWKAEKQKAHEDRKIAELQRELKEERDRETLMQIGEKAGTVKAESKELGWMYKGPNSHVSREEYLLGRKIDKSFEMLQKEESDIKGKAEEVLINKPGYTIEHEINPEQVIQKEDGNIQVDMKRKLLEDPLLMIRQKEESTKRSITSNPVKMKQLELLIKSLKEKRKKKKHKKIDGHKRKNSESRKEKKSKKSRKHKKKEKSNKKKKKHSKKDSSSEDDSDSTSQSDPESEEAIRRRQVKELIDRETKRAFLLRNSSKALSQSDGYEDKKQESQQSSSDLQHSSRKSQDAYKTLNNSKEKRNHDSRSTSKGERFEKSIESLQKERDRASREHDTNKKRLLKRSQSRERGGSKSRSTGNELNKSDRYIKDERHKDTKKKDEPRSNDKKRHSRSRSRGKHSDRNGSEDREEVMKRKREEMIAAAAVRDSERKKNVEKYKEEKEKEDKQLNHAEKFVKDLGSSSVGTSVESRIRSKVGFSQRKSDHMDTNFLRK